MIDINVQKQKLLEEKTELEKTLSSIGTEVAGDWEAKPEVIDENTSDDNDIADRFEEFEERSATLSVLERRMEDILHALEKIDNGTYGICEETGEPIEEERLIANPAARTKVFTK